MSEIFHWISLIGQGVTLVACVAFIVLVPILIICELRS